MMGTRAVIVALFLAAGLVACGKEDVFVPVHELTEQEQQKQLVADRLDPFFALLDPASIEDPVAFVRQNSQVAIGLDGRLIYRLKKEGEDLIYATFVLKENRILVEARLYGGLRIAGYFPDLYVYADGERVAALGIEWLESRPLVVLRYPDGTSYALSSLLITDALLDYLLDNVFSTE